MALPCSQEGTIATLVAQDKALTGVLSSIQQEVAQFRKNQEKQILILTQLTELSLKNQHVLEHLTRVDVELKEVSDLAHANAKDITRVENTITLKLTELANAPAQQTQKSLGAIRTAIIIAVSNAIVIPMVLFLLKASH